MVHARADNRYTRGLAEFSSGLSYQRIPADCSRGDRKTISSKRTPHPVCCIATGPHWPRPMWGQGRLVFGLLRALIGVRSSPDSAHDNNHLAQWRLWCHFLTHATQPMPSYSIISSARLSIGGGSVRPKAVAVVRLTIKSNLVGCATGISPGLIPRKILSTYSAARQNKSGKFGP